MKQARRERKDWTSSRSGNWNQQPTVARKSGNHFIPSVRRPHSSLVVLQHDNQGTLREHTTILVLLHTLWIKDRSSGRKKCMRDVDYYQGDSILRQINTGQWKPLCEGLAQGSLLRLMIGIRCQISQENNDSELRLRCYEASNQEGQKEVTHMVL